MDKSVAWPSFLRTSAAAAVALAAAAPAHAALPADCDALGVALTEHSCFHAAFGPYETVHASAGIPGPEAAPAVDAVHTFYDVVLPSPSAENTVSYQVAASGRAGEWAIFHDPLIPLRVLDPGGRALVPRLAEDVTSCPYLPRATVFTLGPERHRIVLGPAARTHALLVIENVTDFLTRNGRDRDGDGYGDPNDAVTTMCVPKAGYVPDATDCDDGDPARHPGAAEQCDGVDQNCNGVADDEGLPCTAGGGSCQASGAWECRAAGATAVCSAVPAAARIETCDGEDADCDGLRDDQEEGLCGDPAAPRCVLFVGRWSCGCLRDADCGGPESGRLCHDESRTCRDGCVAVGGRNGCPPGYECTSADVTHPGVCEPEACVAPGCGALDGGSFEAEDAGRSPLDAGSRPPEREPRRIEGGCGCETAARTPGDSELAAFAGLVVAIAWRRRRRALSAMCAATLSACGGQFIAEGDSKVTDVEGGAAGGDGPPSCERRLGPRLVSHACRHGEKGPFADVVAAPSAEAAPDVGLVHHAYRIAANPDVASSEGRGFVSLVPRRDGEHAVFARSSAIAARDGKGAPLTVTHEEEVRGCAVFSRAAVVSMRSGLLHVLELDAGSEPGLLFVEHLGTFGTASWDECP